MTDRTHAESRLEAALAAAGLEDSRPALRARLKQLRTVSPDTFEQAVRVYEDEVVPALAEGAAPLETWLQFARRLGELGGGGRFLEIDATGRAASWTPPYRPGSLVLHVPDDPAVPVLPAAIPSMPTPPQQAAAALLVEGRLGS